MVAQVNSNNAQIDSLNRNMKENVDDKIELEAEKIRIEYMPVLDEIKDLRQK